MDCDVWCGRAPQPYSLQDYVIILAQDDLLIGLIVQAIHDVRPLAAGEIMAAPSYGRAGETQARFIAGAAQADEEIIMLLNHTNLLRSATCVAGLAGESVEADGQSAPLIPLIVVGLNGEYFGVELGIVREFAEIHQITPVPCCPSHIIGDMNLRGDILTLVDVRTVLQIPGVGVMGSTAKAMVVQHDELLVGVLVDEVFDVMYCRASDITTVPAALRAESKEYLKGTAPYRGKMLSMLDVPKLLASEDLVVNEDP